MEIYIFHIRPTGVTIVLPVVYHLTIPQAAVVLKTTTPPSTNPTVHCTVKLFNVSRSKITHRMTSSILSSLTSQLPKMKTKICSHSPSQKCRKSEMTFVTKATLPRATLSPMSLTTPQSSFATSLCGDMASPSRARNETRSTTKRFKILLRIWQLSVPRPTP